MSIDNVTIKLSGGVSQPSKQAIGDAKADRVAKVERAEQQRNAIETGSKAADKAQAPDIEAIVAQIDRYLKSVSRSLEFRVDAPSGRTVVSVRDAGTGDLIRQFPGDEVLRLAEMAQEQTIVLVNEKV